jgi:hypothetical protein
LIKGAPRQNNTFQQAQAQFLSLLSAKERQHATPCASAAELVQTIENLDAIALKGPSGKRWLSIVKKFADRLEPYFSIVDIFVSSHPEYAALFWGSLRLVLKVSHNCQVHRAFRMRS